MVEPHEGGPAPDEDDDELGPDVRIWQVDEIRAAVLAGLLLAAGLVLGWWARGGPDGAGAGMWAQIVTGAALVVGGWTFVPEAVRAARHGRIGVDTLMSIAALGAVALGEVTEAAALAFLYSISEGLEEYSLSRARGGLRALLALAPPTATVRSREPRGVDGGAAGVDDGAAGVDGGAAGVQRERVVPAEELRPGDVMVVHPGERVATDGVILTGRTTLDLSVITGESVPVDAGPGDPVYAAAINGGGVLEVEVTAAVQDNSLARIVHIVEVEQARKGAAQRLADRVARPLVPGIMVAAALVAGLGAALGDPGLWIERALVVLVAASPCALAISVPVTVISAVGAASRRGVLVKGGAALEALGHVRTLALDKTGTLTRNDPAVIAVVPVDGYPAAQVLGWAGALEARSEHPLAGAVLAAARERGLDLPDAVDVQAVPGAGLTGAVREPATTRRVRVGRPGWIDAGPLAGDVDRLRDAGASLALVEVDGHTCGLLAVRDEVRAEAREVVATLRAAGYEVVMLTGDHAATARAVGAQAGLHADAVYADLRPEDKARLVRTLRERGVTAMVGDGVNDAPALAAADLGIAMGAMGTDVAIRTADVALMGEDLRALPLALAHARRARRIMVANVAGSLALIAVLIPLALGGVLGLAAVVLVHELAEVVVIANGVRAARSPAAPLPATGASSTEEAAGAGGAEVGAAGAGEAAGAGAMREGTR